MKILKKAGAANEGIDFDDKSNEGNSINSDDDDDDAVEDSEEDEENIVDTQQVQPMNRLAPGTPATGLDESFPLPPNKKKKLSPTSTDSKSKNSRPSTGNARSSAAGALASIGNTIAESSQASLILGILNAQKAAQPQVDPMIMMMMQQNQQMLMMMMMQNGYRAPDNVGQSFNQQRPTIPPTGAANSNTSSSSNSTESSSFDVHF